LPIIKEKIKEIPTENKILDKNEHIRDSTPQTSNQTKIEITNSNDFTNDLNTTEFLSKTNAKTNDLLIAEHIKNNANIISKTTLGSKDLKTIDTPPKSPKRQIKKV
jgi:hypothetical protein